MSAASFRYRLGLNQPIGSPTQKRLTEMAEAIGRETDGEFRLDVFPESRLGPDPQMFADLRAGTLEFYRRRGDPGRRRADQRVAAAAVRVQDTRRCSPRSTAPSATRSAASWRRTASTPSAFRGRTAFTI